jgi:hypothetical protein
MASSIVRPETQSMKRSGFTVVEVMLAMAIFITGITAILGMFQFGGGMERSARSHAELAPVIQPLVESLKAEAWRTDSSGAFVGLHEYVGEPVPHAPAYSFDLFVLPAEVFPAGQRAELRIWRGTPERVAARVTFLLPRRIPVARRLAELPQ